MWAQPGPRANTSSGPPGIYSVGSVLNNGRYRVNKRLNKGATAVVYAAEDLLSGRPVALKVVQCGSSKVPLNVVRREVSLSSSVAHENMVQLLDVFAEGTELIIVWELISGGDLLELLNECNGCMTETAAAFYYAQLLRGVLHMHAMGYCHRDIKPENCMIEATTQRLKLIDFGLSKHLESVATLGVGTPDYMPPEMVRAQMKQQQPQQQHNNNGSLPPYDAKAVDAWAMGVLLYLLVTGCYPFEDPAQPNNLAATLLNVQAGRCQPLPEGISVSCKEVIMGLLCPNPLQRTRLEDLAYNPWLLQSAAAHAIKLGPMGAHCDPGNPAWILPSVHTTAPAPAPAALVPARHSSLSNNSTSSTTGPASMPAGSPGMLQAGSPVLAHAHEGLQAGGGASTAPGVLSGSAGMLQAGSPVLMHAGMQAGGAAFATASVAPGGSPGAAVAQHGAGAMYGAVGFAPSQNPFLAGTSNQQPQQGHSIWYGQQYTTAQQSTITAVSNQHQQRQGPPSHPAPNPFTGLHSSHGNSTTAATGAAASYSSSAGAAAGYTLGYGNSNYFNSSSAGGAGQGYAAGEAYWQPHQQQPAQNSMAGAASTAAGVGEYGGNGGGGSGGNQGTGVQQVAGFGFQDGMDIDQGPAADAVAVTVGHQTHRLLGSGGGQQQQQQNGMGDSRVFGRDQDGSIYEGGGHQGKERKTGFNWLQSLVRKR